MCKAPEPGEALEQTHREREAPASRVFNGVNGEAGRTCWENSPRNGRLGHRFGRGSLPQEPCVAPTSAKSGSACRRCS